MATVTVDPIPRIEGHLGIKLTRNVSNVVTEAIAHGNMFRGFENFLVGRDPNDAITFTQRICGVCPVPHGTTATHAVEAVYGYSNGHITFSDMENDGLGVPPKAVYVRNLILGAEFLMSSITHFYHLAAPSYVQGPNMPPWTPYFHDSYYEAPLRSGNRQLPQTAADGFPLDLWSAVITQYVKALRMRRLTFEAGALFAGRMPMTSAFVAGGVTTQDKGDDFRDKCRKFYNLLHETGMFIVKEYVPLALALGALYPRYDNKFNSHPTEGRPTTQAGWNAVPDTDENPLVRWGIGAGLGNFLSWGAFPIPRATNQVVALHGGVRLKGAGSNLINFTGKANVNAMVTAVNARLIEDTAHSWYVANPKWGYVTSAAKPGDITRTEPDRTKGGDKYSWTKAPRWNVSTNATADYRAMEVGPLARMVIQGFYPSNGGSLAGQTDPASPEFPGYTAYAKGEGLDPRMVDAGLAVALVRVGLATLTVGETVFGTGATQTQLPTGVGARDAIVAAYRDPNAVITGTVANWVLGLSGGLSVMDRVRARALESLWLAQQLMGDFDKNFNNGAGRFGAVGATGLPTGGWVGAAAALSDVQLARSYNSKAVPPGRVSGYGACECPRGSLSHHVSIDKGRIAAYQCVVPTTWNSSPKASAVAGGGRGAMEQAMIGSPYATPANNPSPGVEAMRIAQSFDPCIACAVH